jgi:hypothetical protein
MTQENQSREDIWNQLDAEESAAPVTAPAPAPQEPAPQPAAPSSAAADTGIVNSEAEDPYASLPPQVREEVVGMKTLLTQLSGRLRQAEGHIGNLTGQLKKAREAAPAQPTAAQITAAQGSPEAWKALEDEYPEFAKIMKPAIEAHFASLRSDIESLKTRPQQEAPDVLQRLETTQRELTVEVRHPGWKDLIQTPQFTGWLAAQPPEVKLLADSPEPRDAIRLLDLHSAAKANSGSRNQHLAAAAAIPTGRSSAVRQISPDQMSPQDFWKYLDQLDAQNASAQR